MLALSVYSRANLDESTDGRAGAPRHPKNITFELSRFMCIKIYNIW